MGSPTLVIGESAEVSFAALRLGMTVGSPTHVEHRGEGGPRRHRRRDRSELLDTQPRAVRRRLSEEG